MEQDKETPVESAPTNQEREWKTPVERLQRATQAGIARPSRKPLHEIYTVPQTSTSGKALARQIDDDTWTNIRLHAQDIAREAIGYSSIYTEEQVDNYANRLIVIDDDGSITVYNNPKQSRRAKLKIKAKKPARRSSASAK